MGLVWWLIVGAIAGGAARAIWPGPDPLTIGQTLALGLVGSFVGGFIFNLIGPGSVFSVRRAGLIGSILGAVVALGVWRVVVNASNKPESPPA